MRSTTGLARILGWTPDLIERLAQLGLLQCDGDRILVLPVVRALLAERTPIKPEVLARVDEAVLIYLADTWPDADTTPIVVDRARLNIVRAMLQRYLRPDVAVDLRVMGRILAAAGKSFAAAGLSEEFLAYAQGTRERLPESPELAHLQIVMGELLDRLPDQEAEAGWALQMTLRLDGLDTPTLGQSRARAWPAPDPRGSG